MKKTKNKKKDNLKNITKGIAHIHATFNNTIVAISDEIGNIIAWSSAGKIGFKGSKKSTPYAAQLVAEEVGKNSKKYGMRSIQVQVNGPGPGRDASVRSLQAIGLEITSIKDVTPIPHNGVRPPKKPRG